MTSPTFGWPFRVSHPVAPGKIVQAFIANAERHGKRPTWDDQVWSTGKMTAAWCCNHEGIETLKQVGRRQLVIGIPFFWLFLFFLALHRR